MKLVDVLLFAFTIVTFVIGVHQSITVGFGASYWLFMVSIGFLLAYNLRKRGKPEEDQLDVKPKKGKKKDK